MRLDKYICKSSDLTLLQALEVIRDGDVKVNGVIQRHEKTQIHKNNSVELKGVRLTPRAFRYLLMNKVAGTVCSNIDEVYPSVLSGLDIDNKAELHIVGRLDTDTTGMLLITDDGSWSFHITSPQSGCLKTYRVTLSKMISTERAIEIKERFHKGLMLQGEVELTKPAIFKLLGPQEALLTLSQGKFHQVKRMFAAVGNRVTALHRQQIGGVMLDVKEGEWRCLTSQEVASLSYA
ncbi:pseudouridine synthase [Marinomonas sp.]